MGAIRIQLEYKCYPVWLYDDEGLVEDTALPPEPSDDRELDERLRSLEPWRKNHPDTGMREAGSPCE